MEESKPVGTLYAWALVRQFSVLELCEYYLFRLLKYVIDYLR